jgi:uncharacterized protein (TIGR03382 family)
MIRALVLGVVLVVLPATARADGCFPERDQSDGGQTSAYSCGNAGCSASSGGVAGSLAILGAAAFALVRRRKK